MNNNNFIILLLISLGYSILKVDAFSSIKAGKLNKTPIIASRSSVTALDVSISHHDFDNPIKLPEEEMSKIGTGSSSRSSSRGNYNGNEENPLMMIGPIEAAITKFTMITYIASMCIAIPITLLPTWILSQTKLITKIQKEQMTLHTVEACAKWLLKIMPFVHLNILSNNKEDINPIPSIWCANHVSAIDTFLFLAADEELRGKNKRPLKTIYWKGLEENPILKLFFDMAGFIPIQMEANGSGIPNDYDPSSFKSMLKLTKKAFDDGYDIFILPEGQLNPTPEKGLLDEVFPGAYVLGKKSHRPIRFVAIHGSHHLWHANETIGMTITGRDVSIRVYPSPNRDFSNGQDFVTSFKSIVGEFATTGHDLPINELQQILQLEKDVENKKEIMEEFI